MRQRPDHRAKLKSIKLSSYTQIRPCHILPSSFFQLSAEHRMSYNTFRPERWATFFSLLVFPVDRLIFLQTNTLDISNSNCTPNPIPTILSFFMGRIHWGHNHVLHIGNTRGRRKPFFLFSLGSIQFQLENECQGQWHQNTQWGQFAYVLACI